MSTEILVSTEQCIAENDISLPFDRARICRCKQYLMLTLYWEYSKIENIEKMTTGVKRKIIKGHRSARFWTS